MSKEKDAPKVSAIVKSEKVKDPNRVEAGKRLAAISKEAREKKMKEQIDAENEIEDGYVKSEYLIGLAGVTIAAVSLYLAYKTERVTKPIKSIEFKEEKEEAEEKPKKANLLD